MPMHIATEWGTNYNDLPVNYPRATSAENYQRAGAMAGTRCPFDSGSINNGGLASVNYGPYSKNGPAEDLTLSEPPLNIDQTTVDRHDHRSNSDDYSQAGALFRLMNQEQKEQLTGNIAGSLGQASEAVQKRMLAHFNECDQEYGRMVKESIDG